MSNLLEVGDKDFENEVIKAPGKVLVDFWAPWCAPCRMQSPILESVSGKVSAKIVKVNTDNSQAVSQKYNISSIPTLILFENGIEIDRMVGVQPEDSLVKKLS